MKNFTLIRIGLLTAEEEVVLADNSSECKSLVTEKCSACEETASNTEDKASTSEKEPVEVMSSPESLEEHSLLHNALLFSCVKTASIDQAKLEPSSVGVAMRLACLVTVEICRRSVRCLRVEGQSIASVVA